MKKISRSPYHLRFLVSKDFGRCSIAFYYNWRNLGVKEEDGISGTIEGFIDKVCLTGQIVFPFRFRARPAPPTCPELGFFSKSF